VVLAVVLGVAGCVSGPAETATTASVVDLDAGECFTDLDSEMVATMVACDEPHSSEVVGSSKPSVASDGEMIRACTKVAAEYAGAAWGVDPAFTVHAASSAFARTIVCFVTAIDEAEPLVGSVKGTRTHDGYRDSDGTVVEAAPVLLDAAQVGDCLVAEGMPKTLPADATFSRLPCSQPHDAEVVSVKAAMVTMTPPCTEDVTAYTGDEPPVTVRDSGWTANGTLVCLALVSDLITVSVRAPA